MRSILFSFIAVAFATAAPACAVEAVGDAEQALQDDEIIGPGLVATPGELDFGIVAVGSKKALSLTLTNTGKTSFTCNLLGTDHPAFALSTTWIGELAPGKSITVTGFFAPSKVGPIDSVVFAYDGEDRYLEVPVRGVGK